MFSTLKTLIDGANARAEDRLKDTYAVELIEQRIREAEGNLSAAKLTLASLIQRKRSETRLAKALDARIADLTTRAREALVADRGTLRRMPPQPSPRWRMNGPFGRTASPRWKAGSRDSRSRSRRRIEGSWTSSRARS